MTEPLYDPLTGLATPALLRDRLEHALRRRRRRDFSFALVAVRVHLPEPLANVEHEQLATLLAHRLESCLRPGDTVAQTAADEFLVLLDETSGNADADRVANRLRTEVEAPLHLLQREFAVRITQGVAVGSSGFDTADNLFAEARAARARVEAAADRGNA